MRGAGRSNDSGSEKVPHLDEVTVGVKYYHFDSLYESGSFGRVAPEENFGGFI